MTLPAVVGKYREKANVAALKKSYSALSQALLLAISEYGEPSSWPFTTYSYEDTPGNVVESSFLNLDIIVKYMNVALDCGHEAKGCFADRYLTLKGTPERDFENISYYRKFVTQDGAAFAIQGYTNNPTSGRGEIWVDVNGKKSPNKVGVDTFLFLVDNLKFYPYGLQYGGSFEQQTSSCKLSSIGYSCALWVLTNENQDYL